jgi:hypothetical protein
MAEFANELSDQSDSEDGPLVALSGVAAEPGDVRRVLRETYGLKQKDLSEIASLLVIRVISPAVARSEKASEKRSQSAPGRTSPCSRNPMNPHQPLHFTSRFMRAAPRSPQITLVYA